MKKRCLIILFLFIFSGSAFCLEVLCPLPAINSNRIQAVQLLSLEKVLKSVFSSENYTMQIVNKGSGLVYRVFRNQDSSRVVESGFPGYIGIRYFETAAISELYFREKVQKLFDVSVTGFTNFMESSGSGTSIFRTKPVMIDGIPVLFDADYAGDGFEMAAEGQDGKTTVFLKAVWRKAGLRETVSSSVSLNDILNSSDDLTNQTIVAIKPFYTLTPDNYYTPVWGVTTKGGLELYFNAVNGGKADKLRRKAGR